MPGRGSLRLLRANRRHMQPSKTYRQVGYPQFDENGSIRGRLIQWTLVILSQCEAREHADRRSKRHCNQEPDEPEQISKSKQSEDYPYGIQMNATPDQIG